MPASSAAPTTASVSLRPMRIPKLLHPSPTTETVNEPILRVSMGEALLGGWRGTGCRVGSSVPAAGPRGPHERAHDQRRQQMAAGAVDVTVDAAPDAVWAKVGDFSGVGEFFPGIE